MPSALFALLPAAAARSVSNNPIGYGVLLGSIRGWRGSWGVAIAARPISVVDRSRGIRAALTIVGVVIVATSGSHRLSTLGPVMLIGGGAWIVFISLVSALVQNLAPDWVRARALAIYLLVFQGSVAHRKCGLGCYCTERAGISRRWCAPE